MRLPDSRDSAEEVGLGPNFGVEFNIVEVQWRCGEGAAGGARECGEVFWTWCPVEGLHLWFSVGWRSVVRCH